jgi:hypothetical protein
MCKKKKKKKKKKKDKMLNGMAGHVVWNGTASSKVTAAMLDNSNNTNLYMRINSIPQG